MRLVVAFALSALLSVLLTHTLHRVLDKPIIEVRTEQLPCAKPSCPPQVPCATPTCTEAIGRSCPSEKYLAIDLDSRGGGGAGRQSASRVNSFFQNPLVLDAKQDLLAFTALNEEEMMQRVQREGIHHFKVEHRFFAPESTRELALYYRSSTAYLWGNVVHPALNVSLLNLTQADGPMLDYSGGVGSTCLALALRGIRCVYFGIGLMEFEFAQFRMKRHGVSHLVHFVKPYSMTDGSYKFDPVYSLKLGETLTEPLGGAFALDVFEHIPDYHITAGHIVSLIRPGGKLFENSPFDDNSAGDTEIHLKATMPLQEALRGMTYRERIATDPAVNMWIKD